MISYSENQKVEKVVPLAFLELKELEFEINKLLKPYNLSVFGIKDKVVKHWECGVHYWLPKLTFFNHESNDQSHKINTKRKKIIKYLQNPQKNVFYTGEIISLLQGWVEGALMSVESLFKIPEFKSSLLNYSQSKLLKTKECYKALEKITPK